MTERPIAPKVIPEIGMGNPSVAKKNPSNNKIAAYINA